VRFLSRIAKPIWGKAAAVAVVLGGLMTFLPASAAAAHCVYRRPTVVVRGGFYGPRYYCGPVYVHHRYWDARYHCWRYYR